MKLRIRRGPNLQKHPLPGKALFQGGKIVAVGHRRHCHERQEGDRGPRRITLWRLWKESVKLVFDARRREALHQ